MNLAKGLVIGMAVGDVVIAVLYAWNHDWPRTLYWGFASVVCAATLFFK